MKHILLLCTLLIASLPTHAIVNGHEYQFDDPERANEEIRELERVV